MTSIHYTQLADCCSPPRSHVASRREGRAIVPTLGLERRVPIKGSVGRSYPPVQPLGHSNEGGCGRWCCCCCSCWLSLSLSTSAAVDIWKCCWKDANMLTYGCHVVSHKKINIDPFWCQNNKTDWKGWWNQYFQKPKHLYRQLFFLFLYVRLPYFISSWHLLFMMYILFCLFTLLCLFYFNFFSLVSKGEAMTFFRLFGPIRLYVDYKNNLAVH